MATRILSCIRVAIIKIGLQVDAMKYAIGFIVLALENIKRRFDAVDDYLANWREYPGPHDDPR